MALVECSGFAIGVIFGFFCLYYVVLSSKYLFSLVCTILFLVYVAICLYFHYCQIMDYRKFSANQEDKIDKDELEEKYDDKEEGLMM